MGATETIAKWIVNTNYEDIPPDAIRVANESCFDLLGVILAGSVQPVGEIIQKYTSSQGAAPESTVLAGGFQSTQANAALANGTMGHALDFDDFGGFGHPSVRSMAYRIGGVRVDDRIGRAGGHPLASDQQPPFLLRIDGRHHDSRSTACRAGW